jgi:DNA polymerase I-like protein with 3'-5' exonuclease and polymerase domains
MKVQIVTDIEEIQISTDLPTFCDIETQGLYINTRLIQFYQPLTSDICYILDLAPIGHDHLTYEERVTAAGQFVKSLHTVWYNASYDLGTLNVVPSKVDDLFYAVKTAYPEFQEYGLDKVVTKLGYGAYYDGLDKKKLQKQGFVLGAYLSDAQIRYSAIDVLVLSKMWENERIQKVIKNNLAYKVDVLSLRYAVRYQQNGLEVDLKARVPLLSEAENKVAALTSELPDGFNPNSYKQVREYLDTDKSAHDDLVEYSLSSRPLAAKAKVIIDVKRAKKEASYLESINFPRMYTRFNAAGAATGRFTASGGDMIDGFNSQQIPRQFQGLFKHSTDDTVVVGLDYSTLELRIACAIFGEPTMYKQLINGEDLHTAMAMDVSGKKLHPDGVLGSEGSLEIEEGEFVTKNDRTKAKGINFGFVFGMSANTFQGYAYTGYGVKFTTEECVKLRNKYFAKYPRFKAYHNKVWEEYQKPGFYYETALGRRTKPRLGTDGINGPVQGTGGETTKLAVHFLIKNDCERLGLDYVTEWEQCEVIKYIFNVVHDAIYIRVPKEDGYDVWSERLSKAMVKGWEEISKSKMFHYRDIPMPVGV